MIYHHQWFGKNDAVKTNEILMREEVHGVCFVNEVTNCVATAQDFHGNGKTVPFALTDDAVVAGAESCGEFKRGWRYQT